MQELPVLHPDTIEGTRLSARRASDWVAEAIRKRSSTRKEDIRRINEECREHGYDTWCPGNELTHEYAKRAALNSRAPLAFDETTF
jgi:hypothetical protein